MTMMHPIALIVSPTKLINDVSIVYLSVVGGCSFSTIGYVFSALPFIKTKPLLLVGTLVFEIVTCRTT